MNLRYSICVAFFISLVPLSALAAPKGGSSPAKANQDVVRQAAKSGLWVKQLKDLTAALKQDNTLGEAVKGAIDKGLRDRELADFVQNEIKKRQGQVSAQSQPNRGTPGMGGGQGMMGQGMGMNGGCMGMMSGRGMGQSMMGQGMGMNGGGMGQGMMGDRGQGMGMNGGGMGQGMMGGRGQGMGMGRVMRGGR